MPPSAKSNRVVAWAELALCVVPLSVLWVVFLVVLVRAAGVVTIVFSPLFIGSLAGLVPLWWLLIPRARGLQLPRQLAGWQFVGMAIGVLEALFLLLGSFPSGVIGEPWRYPIVITLAGSIVVAVHVASGYERVRAAR